MEEKSYKPHAIQLERIKVLELSMKVNLEVDQEKLPEPKGFTLSVGHSEYDDKASRIGVKVSATISSEDGGSPFDLTVELMGGFSVDKEMFPVKFIDDWAMRNAPIILYPYLREHVYALTMRGGFEGTLLPLLQVPTLQTGDDKA